jgi:hypothetical protein
LPLVYDEFAKTRRRAHDRRSPLATPSTRPPWSTKRTCGWSGINISTAAGTSSPPRRKRCGGSSSTMPGTGTGRSASVVRWGRLRRPPGVRWVACAASWPGNRYRRSARRAGARAGPAGARGWAHGDPESGACCTGGCPPLPPLAVVSPSRLVSGEVNSRHGKDLT